MKRSCRYCGGTHPIGQGCKPKREKRHTEIVQFRSSWAWTQKAREIQRRDIGCCRVCLSEGTINTRNLSVHHIIPLAKDFSKRLQNGNLITMCEEHHRQANQGNQDTVQTLLRLANSQIQPPPVGGGAKNQGRARPRG